MKNFFVLFYLLGLALPIFANENTPKLIKQYKNIGVSYYYMPDFNIEAVKKTPETKPVNFVYNIFIFNKDLSPENFTKRYKYTIEDDAGYYLDMIAIGIENKPTYFIRSYTSSKSPHNEEVYICKLEKGNWQTKYILNPETDKFVKQVKFNNGRFGITSLCNPDYVPFHDI